MLALELLPGLLPLVAVAALAAGLVAGAPAAGLVGLHAAGVEHGQRAPQSLELCHTFLLRLGSASHEQLLFLRRSDLPFRGRAVLQTTAGPPACRPGARYRNERGVLFKDARFTACRIAIPHQSEGDGQRRRPAIPVHVVPLGLRSIDSSSSR